MLFLIYSIYRIHKFILTRLIDVIFTYSKYTGNNLLHGTIPLLLQVRVVQVEETNWLFGNPFQKLGLKWLFQVTSPDIIEPLVELKSLSLCKFINNTISNVIKYMLTNDRSC